MLVDRNRVAFDKEVPKIALASKSIELTKIKNIRDAPLLKCSQSKLFIPGEERLNKFMTTRSRMSPGVENGIQAAATI